MPKIIQTWYRSLQKRPRLQYQLTFLLVCLATIVFCLLPLRHDGWPHNHEGLAFANRTAIYADHLKQGDVFPVWSSSDAFAMGSPLPLFYHKTFYYVSAPLFAVTDAMKSSIIAAIAIFMIIGAYGMRAAIGRLTDRRLWLFAGPMALLLANYTFTDWLVRGAVAEFSAMMLVPWLVWWCLVLLQEKRYSLWIVPIFFFLFNAHNITAFFAMFVLVIAGALFLARERLAGLKKIWKRLAVSAGLLLVLFVPPLVMQSAFLSDYNPRKITEAGFQASENFKNPGLYFINSEYTWLEDWRTYMVQIDYALWVPLAVGLVGLPAALIWKRRETMQWIRENLKTATFGLLVLSIGFMYLFQWEFMKSVYEKVEVLQYLQFPWRLLAFITPLAILLIIYVVSRFKARWIAPAFVTVWLGMFLVCSPLLHHFKHDFIPKEVVVMMGEWRPGGIGDSLTGIGEYLPRVTQHGQELESMEVLALYKTLYIEERQIEVLDGSCEITRLPETSFDSLTVRFMADCDEESLVALPLSYSRFHEVWIMGDNPHMIDTIRRQDEPRILIKLPKGQHLPIEVKLPTASRVLF